MTSMIVANGVVVGSYFATASEHCAFPLVAVLDVSSVVARFGTE
jgi:hypothetical protein